MNGSRPAHPTRIRIGISQRLESSLGDLLASLEACILISLLRVQRQGLLQTSNCLIICNVHARVFLMARFPVIPGPHQSVLQHWKLVVIVAKIVQEPQREALRNGPSGNRDRAGNGGAQLVARHARNQIKTVVHGFRKPLKLDAVAQEVRAHGKHDIDGNVLLSGSFQKEFEESHRQVPRVPAAIAAPETE